MGKITFLDRGPTEAWQKLMDNGKKMLRSNAGMEDELEKLKNCKVLYKKNEKSQFTLYDIYEEEKDNEYKGEFYAVPLSSTVAGWQTWNAGSKFANIIDSGGDNKVCNVSWIALYNIVGKLYYNNPYYEIAKCCTDGNAYSPNGMSYQRAICCGRICGGHVVQGEDNKSPMPGTLVYILPICSAHNKKDNFYFILREDTGALQIRYLF